jgi:hypothetical protein
LECCAGTGSNRWEYIRKPHVTALVAQVDLVDQVPEVRPQSGEDRGIQVEMDEILSIILGMKPIGAER